MRKLSIEKYIQKHLESKRSEKKKSGYEGWLRKNAASAEQDFSDAIAKTQGEYKKATGRHSSAAEKLSESGLIKSGYAKYVDEKLLNKRNESISEATEDYLKSNAKNQRGYENELARLEAIEQKRIEKEEAERKKAEEKAAAERKKAEEKAEAERKKAEEKAEAERKKAEEKAEAERKKAEENAIKAAEKEAQERKKAEEAAKKAAEKEAAERKKAEEAALKEMEKAMKAEASKVENAEKERERIYNAAKKALEKAKILDYDKAYEYALELGLTGESAATLAKRCTEEVRETMIRNVINTAVNKSLTKNQTRSYALALGLSRDDSEALAEFAFRTNESVSDITDLDNFIDDLLNRANQNN